MYRIYLETIVAYQTVLNFVARTVASTDDDPYLKPYLGEIPVLLDAGLCGFLVDEMSGEFMLVEADAAMMAWWDARPTIESRKRDAAKRELAQALD